MAHDVTQGKDSCGFGLIANTENKASHWLVKTAILSLSRLSHRGAVASDGVTGDGCGVLLKIPDEFFRKKASEANIELPKLYAVGSIFLNSDKVKAAASLNWLIKELKQEKLELLWEREVPTNPDVCGENSLKTLPKFTQIFIKPAEGMDEASFERHLFIARRRTEIALREKNPKFYVASLSCKLIIYKGMIMPHNLPVFYPDLNDESFASSLCVYHQRFSTNTFPEWRLAQPFRMLAHNGEINTIQGNRYWSKSREAKYSSELLPKIEEVTPLLMRNASDSMSLDNMLEGMTMAGADLLQAIKIMIPPAWQQDKEMDSKLKAMYEYYSLHFDPWDGPAGLVFTDGDYACCSMDRNGLRPARYVLTKDKHLTVASEIGVYDYLPEDVESKGRLKPGQMIALNLNTGEFLHSKDIDNKLIANKTYDQWINKYAKYLKPVLEEEVPGCDPFFEHELQIHEKQFGLTIEERDQVLQKIAENGQEAIGSMGDDTPLAVLSKEVRPLYEYFRQQFAQVTNPPIDPIREKHVMSLKTCIGMEENPFSNNPGPTPRIEMDSPILSRYMFKSLLQPEEETFKYETIDLTYVKDSNLISAISEICDKAEKAVRNGKMILILTDRRIRPNRIPIHALLATGAVNARLCEQGLRCDCNIVVETGTARDPHHFAALIGFGATAIYPYLSYQTLYDMHHHKQIDCKDTTTLMQKYRFAIEKGLLKILSKMGISTINSYRGAMLFEAIGLHEEVIDLCFPGCVSRIQGATFEDLENDMRALSARAWDTSEVLEMGGLMKFYPHGEYHAFNPDVVTTLQKATRENNYKAYKKFAELVDNRPYTSLRDMLRLAPDREPIDIDEVEDAAGILKRFQSAGMSIGALSPEAHEALAIAMNRIGARSVSGEGGEDKRRYRTEKNSAIKQIASGRFGVTPEYLIEANGIQIKIAQGAKPGEGGQLPGHKVDEYIAKLRYTKVGTTLISPPPHHDIYSIEDLAQLIFDLKQINPQADISVKLVAESGVGTIAAGVAKTYADSITISGHDGGTGASPLTSIRYAGIPWELGLTETHQVLRANDLRDKVKVQADGGLKTGLDVIKAAILGAESYGFGTPLLITLGCKYLRICHLNNCATGVATQQNILRDKHYRGLPEQAESYLRFLAQDVREWLAFLGAKSIKDIIGRTELLEILPGITEKQKNLALEILLTVPEESKSKPQYCTHDSNPPFDKGELAELMVQESLDAIENKQSAIFEHQIKNINRSIGARTSGEIAKRYGNEGLESSPITFKFRGSAGQSFGVWNIAGQNLLLEGDANDYVGKGMAGGLVAIYPPANSTFIASETPVVGNTCLYGATGGKLFASGLAGERFGVRNSGCIAVVEGIGDHGLEYMTGGVALILGETGINFGAGMTGGFAIVYDPENKLEQRVNPESVRILNFNETKLEARFEDYVEFMQDLLANFIESTGSKKASNFAELLRNDRQGTLSEFRIVKPLNMGLEVIDDYWCKSVSGSRAQAA